MRQWNWKLRAGAGLAAAVAAVVIAGAIATLAMGGGAASKSSAHVSATATPGGRIAATCLRTAPNCNDTKFGSGGDTELTCEQAQACPTVSVPPTTPCDPVSADSGRSCGPAIACPMLPEQPVTPTAGDGEAGATCRPCVYASPDLRPERATPSTCIARCIEPLAPDVTPISGRAEPPPTIAMPACAIRCDAPDMPPCPVPPVCPPLSVPPSAGGAPTPSVMHACPIPVQPCGMLPNGPIDATPVVAPACPPPLPCNDTMPAPAPGAVEPQSGPSCVAPGCAISSDGRVACPTPGVEGGSAGSSGSGVAEPGTPVQVAPAPPSAQ